MTLTENFLHDAIELDRNAEVMFGSDQIYDTCPCHFPTVEFQLTATDALVEVADRIRMEKGYLPMHPRDGRTDDVDNDGWYDFYVGISEQLQMSVNTVKSYCKRHNLVRMENHNSSSVRFCLQCGNEIKQEQHRKTKKFCSDRCRMIWWRKHSSLLRTPSKQTFICPICHEAFSAYSSAKQKYCSRLCYARSKEVTHE